MCNMFYEFIPTYLMLNSFSIVVFYIMIQNRPIFIKITLTLYNANVNIRKIFKTKMLVKYCENVQENSLFSWTGIK